MILGAHMSIAKGFAQAALTTAQEYKGNALQFFTKSPRGGKPKPIDPADAQTFQDTCKKNHIKYVIAHSSYLLNFAQSPHNISWALKDLMNDFERLALLGGNGVVVHIGKCLSCTREEAIHNVIENAKKVIDATEKCVSANHQPLEYILENTAGQGSEIGFQLEELALIWKGLKGFSPRLKSCLDTAHIWAAGYDISTEAGASKLLQEYEQLIGIKTLSCFHFNDSKKACGSKVDRHQNIGKGFIGLEGLKTVARFASQKNIPLILETPEENPGDRIEDVEKVKNFSK